MFFVSSRGWRQGGDSGRRTFYTVLTAGLQLRTLYLANPSHANMDFVNTFRQQICSRCNIGPMLYHMCQWSVDSSPILPLAVV